MEQNSKKYLEINLIDGEFRLIVSKALSDRLSQDTSTTFIISSFGNNGYTNSFLGNCLCNDAHSFRCQGDTRGADLSNTVKTLFEFSGGDESLKGIPGSVRFIDMEQFTPEKESYFIPLNTPTLLVSSVITFSWVGSLEPASNFINFFAFKTVCVLLFACLLVLVYLLALLYKLQKFSPQ